ncbi:hypothetical protein B0H16DRAFT_911301 [Mycena metata]|uniref:Secreted protein n=1 Tax=Mycena metata TaxID=1033252 RepID=A0AAD7N6L9_9AGAR|nr:hypothetical protein B0H16DRAFT_911301 [Mycena metata]
MSCSLLSLALTSTVAHRCTISRQCNDVSVMLRSAGDMSEQAPTTVGRRPRNPSRTRECGGGRVPPTPLALTNGRARRDRVAAKTVRDVAVRVEVPDDEDSALDPHPL